MECGHQNKTIKSMIMHVKDFCEQPRTSGLLNANVTIEKQFCTESLLKTNKSCWGIDRHEKDNRQKRFVCHVVWCDQGRTGNTYQNGQGELSHQCLKVVVRHWWEVEVSVDGFQNTWMSQWQLLFGGFFKDFMDNILFEERQNILIEGIYFVKWSVTSHMITSWFPPPMGGERGFPKMPAKTVENG